MMSVLLEADEFDGTSNQCCLEDEILERNNINDCSELFYDKNTIKTEPGSFKPLQTDIRLNGGSIGTKEMATADKEIVMVDIDSTSTGSDCVILKMDDRGSDSKAVYLTGRMLQLADGSFAFIENSKNGENDVYTPITLYNGSILYVLTNTLLCAMGEAKPLAETSVKRDKNKGFPCSYSNCTKSYASLHHLKVHMRVHTGIRPFKCPDEKCNKAFSTGFGLKTHIRTHNGERPYVCRHRECEKSFKTSGDLHKHIRIHTGERPFVCPIPECGRSFTTCNICKVHVRTHTGERPYKCTYPNCNKTFASVTNQRNHLRIHSGEKPYVCAVPECGRRFTEYSSLYKHNQIHRLRQVCSFCGKTFRTIQRLAMHIKSAHNHNESMDDNVDVSEVLLVNGTTLTDDVDEFCKVELCDNVEDVLSFSSA